MHKKGDIEMQSKVKKTTKQTSVSGSRRAKKVRAVVAPKAVNVNLVVKFSGLCGFVFNSAGTAGRVVLVDAGDHQPAMLVPDEHWDGAANPRTPNKTYTS